MKRGNYEKITEFSEGDYICHIDTYNTFPIWFTATNSDVENYSGKNGIYLRRLK